MNLGSIVGLGCLCRPFPAGFTNLGGGRQPRSIGLSTWTVAPIFEASFGILVEFGVLEVSTFPSAKYHPYDYTVCPLINTSGVVTSQQG